MLTAMRKGSDNWFIKIFLGIVVLGFIATGGLLSYSSVQSNSYVATVGEANVTGDEFFASYSQEANNYSRRLGQELQPQFLKLIEQTTVSRLVNRAALENTGIELNLAIDDATVAKEITDNPNFSGASGEFDKAIFDGVMRENNLAEKDYVNLIKEQKILDQLTGGLANIQFSPQVYASIVSEFNDEQRIAEYFHLTPAKIEIGETPTGEALETYYKTVIENFDAPEYRKVETLALDPEVIAKTMTADAEEVKAQFELNKSSYNSVETRIISQLLYDNMEKAEVAFKKSAEGTSFADLAAEKGITDTSYILGEFAKSGLPNKKMAEIAFLLEADSISQPVDLGLGVALLQVSKITPAVSKTFEDVKESIEKSETLRLAIDKVYELRDEVEDEIAGGATFKEVSDKLKIAYNSIENVDASSLDMNGEAVDLSATVGLLGGIFNTNKALDNEPLDTANGGLVWYVVTDVTERHNKPLADVADEVSKRWRDEQTIETLRKKAEELVEKGGKIEDLSEGFADAISIASAVKRSTQSVQLSASAIAALFEIKKDGLTFVASELNGEPSYLIMQVTEIIAPDEVAMNEENSQILKSIASNLSATLLESYIENNKSTYGISINQDLVDRITGAGNSSQ